MAKPRALVYGLAVAGQATARALVAHGYRVIAADDRPTEAGMAFAAEHGIDLHEAPPAERVGRLVERVDLVVPSPGVPDRHAALAAARSAGIPVRTELDLAYEWEQYRPGGPRPILAITGTDGKTTTTMLTVAILEAAGHRAVAAGNTDIPLVSALDLDVDVLVVECTSFRLAYLTCFRPDAAVWLNLAEDHLDWHSDVGAYGAAKARIWEFQTAADTAIGFAPDPTVMAYLGQTQARRRTFALAHADYHVADGFLTGPAGPMAAVNRMRRSLPHDITNALAASALVLESGLADNAAIDRALANFEGIKHRISFVREADGIRWYDDSKATTPHAALTAIRGFDHVVLIAGGRNKNLDLRSMASEPGRMRAVVATGEAADEITEAFEGVCPIEIADSMSEAVRRARSLAQTGDSVLLSPGCTSFDWYTGYGERGDDFAKCVAELLGGGE